jgi:hypothetical protein
MSNGDQPGTVGGVKSNVFMKEATWILYSFDVKLDGKNACRFTDKMFHNSENTANLAGVIQAVVVAQGLDELAVELLRFPDLSFRERLAGDGFGHGSPPTFLADTFSVGSR